MILLGFPANELDEANPDWVPNQQLGYTSILHPKISSVTRLERVLKRAKGKKISAHNEVNQIIDINDESVLEILQSIWMCPVRQTLRARF